MHRPKTYRRKSRKSRKGKRSTKRRVGGHTLADWLGLVIL